MPRARAEGAARDGVRTAEPMDRFDTPAPVIRSSNKGADWD
jgi:hypothetical protein